MMNGSYFIDNLSICRAWIRLFFARHKGIPMPSSEHISAMVLADTCVGHRRYLLLFCYMKPCRLSAARRPSDIASLSFLV